MTSEAGISDKRLYWPLTFAAEIGLDALRLYEWGLGRLRSLERRSVEFLYTVLCCSFLVRDFLPQKKAEFTSVLRSESEARVELKQVLSLIFH